MNLNRVTTATAGGTKNIENAGKVTVYIIKVAKLTPSSEVTSKIKTTLIIS